MIELVENVMLDQFELLEVEKLARVVRHDGRLVISTSLYFGKNSATLKKR